MSRITESPEFTREEVLQAQRCHAMHMEGLRYAATPDRDALPPNTTTSPL